MKFEHLIQQIEIVHNELQKQAIQQVNNSLTIRNLLIGFYIVEFEQKGEERAVFGDDLLKRLSGELKAIRGLSLTNLKLFRQFYLAYPGILMVATRKVPQLDHVLAIGQTVSDQLPGSETIPVIDPERLLSHLSFS